MASDSEPLGEPVRDEYEVEIQEISFERPDVFHYCKSRWKKIAIGLFFGSIGLFILCMVLGLGIRFVEEDEFATLTYPNVALINTSTGAFRGISNAGAYSFLGMPYVLIPDDEPLWWKEVQSDSSEDLDVNDPEDATEFSDPCLQRTLTGDLSGSPDCLYINVWTPSLNSSARLDVMVFIHGGGLMTGSGNEAGAVPSLVLAKEMNMVFVSFNYRLNVFGYLAIKSGQETLNGNYGLADQILALQWVQKNIRLFGGAANKVTVFGQGSGATSIYALLGSARAQGLFHRAWLMSPAPLVNATLEASQQANQDFLNKTECVTRPPGSVLGCLSNLSVESVMNAVPWDKWENRHLTGLPLPDERSHQLIVIDGKILPRSPVDAWKSRVPIDVPLLIGNVELEMDGAELEDASWSEYDDLVKQAFDRFDQSGNFSQQVLTRYKRRDTPQIQLARLVSDVRALCPVNRVADMASKTFTLPVYRYILEASSSGDDMRQFFGFGTAGARGDSLLVKYALRQAVKEFVQSGRIDSWSTADRGLNVINASNARVDVRPGKVECSLFEGYGLVPKYALVN